MIFCSLSQDDSFDCTSIRFVHSWKDSRQKREIRTSKPDKSYRPTLVCSGRKVNSIVSLDIIPLGLIFWRRGKKALVTINRSLQLNYLSALMADATHICAQQYSTNSLAYCINSARITLWSMGQATAVAWCLRPNWAIYCFSETMLPNNLIRNSLNPSENMFQSARFAT
jgi:hypothetical protein